MIGAQKCGTSGLHYYLSLHPEISMSKPKELNFFIEERNWPRGEDWYRAHFDARARVRGESSPNYTAYPQHLGVPERMHSVVPDAKLIYMVRDPLERIAAHWVHNYAKRREKGDLRATLTHPNTSYVARSQYHMQLQQFLAHYPLEQIARVRAGGAPHQRPRRRCAGCSSSSASTRASATLASASSATRPRARRAPRRLAVRLERLGAHAAGAASCRRTSGWRSTSGCRCAARSSGPTSALALGPDALQVLREDAERLRELTGRDFATWSIWDA